MQRMLLLELVLVILFIGLIRKYKGVDKLIKAFHYLSKENKDLKLIIAGEFYDNILL